MKPYALYFSDPQSYAAIQWTCQAENPDHALRLFAGGVAEIGHGREDEYSPERLCWCVVACRELAPDDLEKLDAYACDDDGAWQIVLAGADVTPSYCLPR